MRTAIAVLAALLLPVLSHAKVVGQTLKLHDAQHEVRPYIAWDDAIAGRRPAVIVVHEWWGLDDYARQRADELAAEGYVAFAVDMYGMGRTTKELKEAAAWSSDVAATVQMEERMFHAVKHLQNHELVDPDRIAAVGFCFGGTTVTRAAYYGLPLQGVVSLHGSLPTPEAGAGETCKARILVLHGAADPIVPEAKVEAFKKAVAAEKLDLTFVAYAGATHAYTNPASAADGIDGTDYHADAAAKSMAATMAFLKAVFAPAPAD